MTYLILDNVDEKFGDLELSKNLNGKKADGWPRNIKEDSSSLNFSLRVS